MDIKPISVTKWDDSEVMDVAIKKYKASTFLTNECYSKVVNAILNNEIEDVKSFFEDRTLVDDPLWSTGSLAGYTALHLACLENNKDLVELLVEYYYAYVNVVADDGAQPIHLACLHGNESVIGILLNADANVHAEIDRDLFLKYAGDRIWCDDFGDKMTILTFGFLYRSHDFITIYLASDETNLKVKSMVNKTLVMYAFEKNNFYLGKMIAEGLEDREFINARDNEGFSAIHYILHPKKFQNNQYPEFLKNERFMGKVIQDLIFKGADIYATINDDPDTLLLNMAAYRGIPSILRNLFCLYEFITKSKALYLATRSLQELQTTLREDPTTSEHQLGWFQKQLEESIELILKDLVNRRTFGLSVPKREKILMDELIAEDLNIAKLVHTYEENFINGELKQRTIQYDNKSIPYYDFILLSLNDKTLRPLVNDKKLMKTFRKSFPVDDDYLFFNEIISMKVERAMERLKLLDKFKNAEQLKNAIPLPYELILEIIEYFSIYDLEVFIDAFF